MTLNLKDNGVHPDVRTMIQTHLLVQESIAGNAKSPGGPDWSQALNNPVADKRLDVLRRVALGDSISQAAREVGISYKAAWQAIDTLTNLCGVALVERTVGGAGGGGARITHQGLQLLGLADALAQARQQVLASFGAAAVRIGGLGLRTSMRNQLPCRVLRCSTAAPDDPTVQVSLQTQGGAHLGSSLTRESADLLGLAPGLAVLVMCKATAVAVVPVPEAGDALPADAAATCFLTGSVQRLSAGVGRDEVVLALPGGGSWVGFAQHPFTPGVGSDVRAQMASSALVIGLTG